jgi:hypothetical protein
MKPALVLALALAPLAAHAEIYRCTSGGTVTYQEIPCPASAEAARMDIPAVFPEVNRAERDRLFAREAALDARLLRRAEIDASERIARDDRAAREREIAALREELARREAEPGGAGFVVLRRARPTPIPRRIAHRPLPGA